MNFDRKKELSMKTVKLTVLSILGILAFILTVGCAQPTVSSPEQVADFELGADVESNAPFMVSFTIKQDDVSRSVAGPDSNRINLTGAKGLRNYTQLIVLEQNSKTIADYVEAFKWTATSSNFDLSLNKLTVNKPYAFLLLMGHWDRVDSGTGKYIYDINKKPTLLAAGLTTDQTLLAGEETTVNIQMWPVLVDTTFTNGTDRYQPNMINRKPQPIALTTGNWNASWEIARPSGSTTRVLERVLIPAQQLINSGNNNLLVKAKRLILSGNVTQTTGATSVQFPISLPFTVGGGSGSVNFNLEYVPFNLTGINKWSRFVSQSKFFDMTETEPVWIIRNGLNDLAQDENTDFSSDTEIGPGTNKNGNGAVAFTLQLEDNVDPSLRVEEGQFIYAPDSPMPIISFRTRGYPGGAVVWYAVTAPGALQPDIDDYSSDIGDVEVGLQVKQINLPSEYISTGYDVHVLIQKDNKRGNPATISFRNEVTLIPEIEWDDEEDESGYVPPEKVTQLNISLPMVAYEPIGSSISTSQYTGEVYYRCLTDPVWNQTRTQFEPGDYEVYVRLNILPNSNYTFKGRNNSFKFNNIQMVCDYNWNSEIWLMAQYTIP
jgi:hypothetical protein